jgi:hypothetical protein
MSSYTYNTPSIPNIGLPGMMAQDLGIGKSFRFQEEHMFSGLDIRITPAHGGTIVSVSQGPGNSPTLYVVGEEQDLGTEVGKIITMTCLTKET